ncbi:hypothetical protein AAEJ74_15755 [Limnospira fusiformis PMC 851.14]|uniref:Uncharacterized protein n=1 Tax=Limnospira fusiformis PMC 851.14 TaxID=2219512 RepID=A0ABU9EM95_LIMFS
MLATLMGKWCDEVLCDRITDGVTVVAGDGSGAGCIFAAVGGV